MFKTKAVFVDRIGPVGIRWSKINRLDTDIVHQPIQVDGACSSPGHVSIAQKVVQTVRIK